MLEMFKEKGALLEGHFILSSGLHSNRYFQSALLLQDTGHGRNFGPRHCRHPSGHRCGGLTRHWRLDHWARGRARQTGAGNFF